MKIRSRVGPRTLTDEQIRAIRKQVQSGQDAGTPSTYSAKTVSEDQPKEPSHPESPSTALKVSHAAQAVGRVISATLRGQAVKVSSEEKERRLSICRSCKFWNEGGNRGLGECKHEKCGCTRFKHGLATEKCPLGKWGTSESK